MTAVVNLGDPPILPTHRHAGTLPVACTEIDSHVCLREWRSDAGVLIRFVIAHDVDGQESRCEGSIPVVGATHPKWDVAGSLAGGDLTLTPSILEPADKYCPGMHGYVTNGKWVPA